ncbi:ubiquinone biosynthesis accessory factor UbiJ [Carnimonas bestiolae]|uniref:ubiquinone biosynthesis accessory factor UbiJ n=1 Tax=Carnimonas bestiolae TaxID=3402172 RepID=UPI003F4AF261
MSREDTGFSMEHVEESPMTLFAPLALACIETTLNRVIARDPAAPGRLARLSDKRIVVRLEHPDICCMALFRTDGISLSRLDDPSEGDADATVELSAETLAELLAGKPSRQLMFDGSLAVRGDIHVLEQVQTLLMDLDIDWEGALASKLGESPAHALATGIRRLTSFGVRSGQQLRADLYEYTFEQGRWLAGQDQLERARDQLTQLEVSTDRLEARFERIKRHLAERLGGHQA